jgi:Ser/Thr protein kinase RdoA (MazF antagonist)
MSSATEAPQQDLADTNINCTKEAGFEIQSAALCPHIENPETITQLLKTSYGFEVIQLKRQNGYDDLNYHVLVAPDHSNPHIGEVSPEGYFLKISNLRDSQSPEYLYAQLAIMEHLQKKGILCQTAIRSISGDTLTECTSANKEGVSVTYLANLRTYLPGTIIADVALTPKLLYNVGQYVAKITQSLQDFKHPFYESFYCQWSMNSIPSLAKILFAVQDDKRRRISGEVIQSFIADVETNKHGFRTGQVHGDVNEQNILVTTDSAPEISGLLDYQDSHESFPIYDLAMAVAYMLMAKNLEVPVLDTPGHILAGYTSLLDLHPAEAAVFKTLVAGRMVQSLVMGAYTFSLDPVNQYVLTTGQCGWRSLEIIWEASEVEAQQRWQEIVKSLQ